MAPFMLLKRGDGAIKGIQMGQISEVRWYLSLVDIWKRIAGVGVQAALPCLLQVAGFFLFPP